MAALARSCATAVSKSELAHRFLRDQAPIARQVLLRVDEIRLRLRKTRLRLGLLRLEGPRIDYVKEVALSHSRAVVECLPLQQARDLGADLDRAGACVCATYSLLTTTGPGFTSMTDTSGGGGDGGLASLMQPHMAMAAYGDGAPRRSQRCGRFHVCTPFTSACSDRAEHGRHPWKGATRTPPPG
jgi:hypothetical protein